MNQDNLGEIMKNIEEFPMIVDGISKLDLEKLPLELQIKIISVMNRTVIDLKTMYALALYYETLNDS